MKKQKLSLDALKVKSFVTSLDSEKENTIKGGVYEQTLGGCITGSDDDCHGPGGGGGGFGGPGDGEPKPKNEDITGTDSGGSGGSHNNNGDNGSGSGQGGGGGSEEQNEEWTGPYVCAQTGFNDGC